MSTPFKIYLILGIRIMDEKVGLKPENVRVGYKTELNREDRIKWLKTRKYRTKKTITRHS